jgi:hypothetical protein
MTTTSITFANKPPDKEEQHGRIHEIVGEWFIFRAFPYVKIDSDFSFRFPV